MVAVHVAAKYEHLILAEFLNVFRGNLSFHDLCNIILSNKKLATHRFTPLILQDGPFGKRLSNIGQSLHLSSALLL